MKTCINCNAESDRLHCPECGQKLEVRKVTWRSIADEVGAHWLGFNNQFFRAVKHLTTRPELVINSYLNGNRVKYIGPLGYLIVMSALYLLAFDYLEIDKAQYFRDIQEAMGVQSMETSESEQLVMAMNQKMGEYMRLLPALNIPFFALGVWILFRRRGLNYLENVVAMSYMQAHLLWLSIVALAVYKYLGSAAAFLAMIPMIAYYTFGITRLYVEKNYFKTAVRSLFSIVLGNLLLAFFLLILGLVIGLLLVSFGTIEPAS